MPTAVLELDHVSKRYYLGRPLGGYTTLREVLASRMSRGVATPRDELWALRDVSFSLAKGEALGIIGHNGAGKSTLLKLLARITLPTSGVSRTRGRVGSLLDVGTGFHPELTGRENIYFNGAVLGMRRSEIRRRFDEIVEFSGLERFLETPLKRYSWGMWLRLAFGVAAHLDPDIMLVDEVLAVGDVEFRTKCLNKMTELGNEGRTVVFVSHDLGAMAQLCERALWIERGSIRGDGPTSEMIEQYVRSVDSRSGSTFFGRDLSRRAELVAAAVVDADGEVLDMPRRDLPLGISVRVAVRERIPGLDLSLTLRNRQGVQILEEMYGLDTGQVLAPEVVPAELEVRLTMPPVLAPGEYTLGVWIGSSYETVFSDPQALSFRLWPRPDESSKATERNRVLQPGVEWQVELAADEADVV
jgi:ABC-type polysaccharide/polyol phosphate transport system ATPase subunit